MELRMHEDIERYWSKELGESVDILPRGFKECADDYALYIEGTFVVAYRNLSEIEDYLGKYFVKGAS